MTSAPAEALYRAFQYANDYLGSLDQRPVCATASLEQLRARLGGELAQNGLSAEQVIDELIAASEGGHLGSATLRVPSLGDRRFSSHRRWRPIG